MKKIKKTDVIYISILLTAVFAFTFFFNKKTNTDDDVYVVVEANGYEYGRYPVYQDASISINNKNILEIQDGDAIMVWADCNDQLCTGQGHLQTAMLQMIVCLPNQVLVRLEGNAKPALDGVS